MKKFLIKLMPLWKFLGVYAAYFLTAKFGLNLAAVHNFAAVVWAPTGIALATFIGFGPSYWPAIFLAAFSVNFGVGQNVPVALGIAAGNTLEALAGMVLLRKFQFQKKMESVSDVIKLLTLGAAVSTLLSASIGTLTLRLADIISSSELPKTWSAWWIGDMIGDAVFAPFLLVLFFNKPFPQRKGSEFEGLLVVVGIVTVSLMSFGIPPLSHPYPITYFEFPLLLWAAIRFYQPGAVIASGLVVTISTWETFHGKGPFTSAPELSENLKHLQYFLGVYSITGLVVSAVNSQRQAALKQAHEALRIRNEFFSIASHELGAPLTALHLQIQILLQKIQRPELGAMPTREGLTAALLKALAQARKLSNIIDDFLDVTKIQAGRLTLEYEKFNFAQMTSDVVERHSDQLRMARAPVELTADYGILGFWDKMRIEQIIVNLLTNAIKYASGGPIKITVARGAKGVTLSVQDSGPGMDRELKERLFERFERGPSRNKVTGLGLGLYIVRKIVEAHLGEIAVYSELGKGSLFVVDLPLNEANPSERSKVLASVKIN